MMTKELISAIYEKHQGMEPFARKIELAAVQDALLRFDGSLDALRTEGLGLTLDQTLRIREIIGGYNAQEEEQAPLGKRPGERTIDTTTEHRPPGT